MQSNPDSLGPGTLIGGKYRVERIIGQGGMGVVALATHVTLRTPFAVKIILPQHAASLPARQRLMEEAQNAGRIPGDHVVRVVDADVQPNGIAYIAMEYLEGHDLAQEIEVRGALPYKEVVEIIAQGAGALAAAHRLGIIHRDIKPSNLFLTSRTDGSRLVKVLDFGISKDTSASTRADLTTTAATLGSPLYMSPEQMTSPRSVDARTDVWSLGVVLFEALTGMPPFMAETLGGLSVAIATAEPPDLGKLAPETPRSLVAIVTKCLEKSRDRRFSTADELQQALVGALGDEAGRSSAVPARRVASGAAFSGTAPGTSTEAPDRRASKGSWIVAGALVACALGATAALATRYLGASPAATSPAAPTSADVVTQVVPGTPPSAPPASSAPEVTPVDPSAPRPRPPRPAEVAKADSAKPEAAKPQAAAPPPKQEAPKPDCNPPYVIDANGHKKFKPQCI